MEEIKHPFKSGAWWREVIRRIDERSGNETIDSVLSPLGVKYQDYYTIRSKIRRSMIPPPSPEQMQATILAESAQAAPPSQPLTAQLSTEQQWSQPVKTKVRRIDDFSVDELIDELKKRVDSAIIMAEFGEGKYNFKVKGTKAQYKFLLTLIGLHASKEFDPVKDGIA